MTVFSLKILACVSMFIDHLGVALFPDLVWMRYVGRLAFPIYAFLLTEGYRHTSDVKKYLGRLFVFALISEVPFDLVLKGSFFYLKSQNVLFTLFLGLLLLYIIDHSNDLFTRGAAVISVMLIAQYVHCDYRYPGIWMMLIFAYLRDIPLFEGINIAAVNIRLFASPIQTAGAAALFPIALYNGKKGPSLKYFFYFFFPGHLLIIYMIGRLMGLK